MSTDEEIKAEAIEHIKQVGGNNACYDSYIAGRSKSISRERELEEALRELVRCNPVWKENLLSADVTLEEFTSALTKAKNILNKTVKQ